MSHIPTVHLDGNGIKVEHDLLNAHIVALFLESAFYGVFVVTYSIGLVRLLVGHQYRIVPRRNQVILAAHTLMFLLATAHLVLTVQLTLQDFNTDGPLTLEGIYDSLSDSGALDSSTTVAQFYIYVTQTLIGDAFMIYRMFVVWGGSRRVLIAPILFFFLDAAGGYASYPIGIRVIMYIFYVFSFFTNMLCSGLIMWRILRSNDLIQMQGPRWRSRVLFTVVHYRAVFEAIIQSAAIYSTASVSLIVTSLLSPNVALMACLSVFPPLIGIVFSFIVIKIARSETGPEPSCRKQRQEHPSSMVQERWSASMRDSATYLPPFDIRTIHEAASSAPSLKQTGSVSV